MAVLCFLLFAWAAALAWFVTFSSAGPPEATRTARTVDERLEAPDVSAVEALLGWTLPPDVVAFYRDDPRRFLTDCEVDGSFVAWFCPMDHETLREFGGAPPELLPLATDGCGSLYVVDMNHPTLRVLFLDEGEAEPFEESASFDDFLERLTTPPS